MAELSKDLVAASSIPLILTILKNGESYGYEIINQVKELSGGTLEYPEGTLYPILRKLEERKLIESFWKIGENARQRRYYRLREEGKQVLETEKQNWNLINSILTKLWNLSTPSI
ncbi:MAG: PadR family transcriptional regulator [Spirosomataceae bacterium]